MLLAVFRSHEERYAIGVGSIVEVIPLVKLYSMPNTPDYFAGIFDYRGEPTPVLDLSMLTSGQPSRNSISTRIMMIKCTDDKGNSRSLGLKAEQLTDTIKCPIEEFKPFGVKTQGANYVAGLRKDNEGFVRLIDLQELISPEIRNSLFGTLRNKNAFSSTHGTMG